MATAEHVTYSQATDVIKSERLLREEDIWHYSFNYRILAERKAWLVRETNQTAILFPALNSHAPTLVFSNNLPPPPLHNMPIRHFQRNRQDYQRLFWYLRLGSFQHFLDRKTNLSSKPKKHFPTLFTYQKSLDAARPTITSHPYDKAWFAAEYDTVRRDHFKSGASLLAAFENENPQIPTDWVSLFRLQSEGRTQALAFVVDDGRSFSLFSIAARRDSRSFGVVLCTELVKRSCAKGYFSVDAGVSGVYGSYKQKVFLDSYEVSDVSDSIYLHAHEWLLQRIWRQMSSVLAARNRD